MKPAFEDMSLQIPAATAEPEDYTGEDGLLYCGKCRTPKEAYFPADKVALFGRDRHPAECDCQRAQQMCIRDRSYLGIPIQFITHQNFGSGVFFDINYINPSSASYT